VPFTIHEIDHPRFSIELANVAITRATRLENIYISHPIAQPTLEHTKRKRQVQIFPLKDNTNNRYNNTIIYEVWVKGELRYVGHTYLSKEERLRKHLTDAKRNPNTPFHKMLATVNHETDVLIKDVRRYCLENRAQAEDIEMKYLNEKLNEGHVLYNVKQETAEDKKHREIEASTRDMRIQANVLKEVAKKIKIDELQFSILDYPDDKFFNVSHKLLDKEPINTKFKYNNKTKSDVQLAIMKYLNDLRREYNLPQAFTSWDTVPLETLKTKIEKDLQKRNVSSQTFIGFHCVDYTSKQTLKLGYSINNARRKYKEFRYADSGIDKAKDKMSEFMNDVRIENGLPKGVFKWSGLDFEIQEID
jgi:hypothetical protein